AVSRPETAAALESFQEFSCSVVNGTSWKMERSVPASRPTTPPSEQELAALPARRIDELLPGGWIVLPLAASAGSDRGIDGALQIEAPDGRSGTLLTEAKTVVNARDVPALAERAAQRAGTGRTIIATRYLS